MSKSKYKIIKTSYKRIVKKGLIETKEIIAKNLEYGDAQRFVAKYKGTTVSKDKVVIKEGERSSYLEILSQSTKNS